MLLGFVNLVADDAVDAILLKVLGDLGVIDGPGDDFDVVRSHLMY